MANDLPTRLLAAIDEREALARRALAWTRWVSLTGKYRFGVNTVRAWIDWYLEDVSPNSVLRLCQAHREIVEHWQATKHALAAAQGTVLQGACKVRLGAYDNVLKALARGYGIEHGPDGPKED